MFSSLGCQHLVSPTYQHCVGKQPSSPVSSSALLHWSPLSPCQSSFYLNLKKQTHMGNFYWHLIWVNFRHTPRHSSSKWPLTIAPHETLLRSAKLGNRLQLLTKDFQKIPQDSTKIESGLLFPSFISTNEHSRNSQNQNFPKQN